MKPTYALSRTELERMVREAVLESLEKDEERTTEENPQALFHSAPVEALKREIVRTGRKLWERQYVDGNGGNISARLTDNYVLCTPTLVSKGDLQVEDLALVDMDNRRVCGHRRHTSEILLHLEIYKNVPQARAVIHCHPPYATAHAVAGVVPQGNLVPEEEIFVGPVALTPYETPGTLAFARTVSGVARTHNTMLLANHGVACWGDTVTHAEWYVEIVDTYCKTLMLARQLRPDLKEIPPEKIAELLAVKRGMNMSLPDARYAAEMAEEAETGAAAKSAAGIDRLVDAITEKVAARLESRLEAHLESRVG